MKIDKIVYYIIQNYTKSGPPCDQSGSDTLWGQWLQRASGLESPRGRHGSQAF